LIVCSPEIYLPLSIFWSVVVGVHVLASIELIVPSITSPLTNAVLPFKISFAVAVRSLDASSLAAQVPVMPKISISFLIYSAFKLASPLIVCLPEIYLPLSIN
jgi:hypothetical protein